MRRLLKTEAAWAASVRGYARPRTDADAPQRIQLRPARAHAHSSGSRSCRVCARCVSARLKQLPPQLDDVVFVKDPVPGVKGPLVSRQGLHLVYLHSCGEPMGRTEALFSPPPSLQAKMGEMMGQKKE